MKLHLPSKWRRFALACAAASATVPSLVILPIGCSIFFAPQAMGKTETSSGKSQTAKLQVFTEPRIAGLEGDGKNDDLQVTGDTYINIDYVGASDNFRDAGSGGVIKGLERMGNIFAIGGNYSILKNEEGATMNSVVTENTGIRIGKIGGMWIHVRGNIIGSSVMMAEKGADFSKIYLRAGSSSIDLRDSMWLERPSNFIGGFVLGSEGATAYFDKETTIAEIGKITFNALNASNSYGTIVGGSWVYGLDIKDGSKAAVIKQGDVTVNFAKSCQGRHYDIYVAGMQGSSVKIVTENTTYNNVDGYLTYGANVGKYDSSYNNGYYIISGGYLHTFQQGDKTLSSPFFSFYNKIAPNSVSTVTGERTFIYGDTSASYPYGGYSYYGDTTRFQNVFWILNFDTVKIAPLGYSYFSDWNSWWQEHDRYDKTEESDYYNPFFETLYGHYSPWYYTYSMVANGLSITDTGEKGDKNKITLCGGGELLLLAGVREVDAYEYAGGDTPFTAKKQKMLNNSYISVEGAGTTLRVNSEANDKGNGSPYTVLYKVDIGSEAAFKVQDDYRDYFFRSEKTGKDIYCYNYLWRYPNKVAVLDSLTFDNNSDLQFYIALSIGNQWNTGRDQAIIYKPTDKIEGTEGLKTTAATVVANGLLKVSVGIVGVHCDLSGQEVYTVLVDKVELKNGAKIEATQLTLESIRKWFQNGAAELKIDKEGRLVLSGRVIHLSNCQTNCGDDNIVTEPEPTGPNNPNNPTEPETPNNPTEPENPNNPTEPENPNNPTEPENPNNPTEPENPNTPNTPDTPPNYHEESSETPGGTTGGELLDEFYPDPSDDNKDRNKVLDSVFNNNVDGNRSESDRIMSAVAGSSIPALGMAMADDVERQLRLMRNRAIGSGAVGEDNPEVRDGKGGLIHEATFAQRNTVWINGESDFRDISADRTNSGYKMNSWGGTFGVAHTTRRGIDLGLAVTAMYGDFTSHGPDELKADTETYYLSGFAQVERGKWSHTLVATVGMTNLDGDRTVQIGRGYGSYTTQFETDGYLLGVLYELGYSIALNRSHTAYLQPVVNASWRHVELGGFTERGSDAALRAGDQTLDNVTVGAGARLYGEVNRNVLNRPIQLEARALVKYYGGDAQNQVEVGFADRAARGTVQSRECDKLGVELGGSATLPLRSRGRKAHAIFMDANSELRGAYTNLNATLGYKVQF